MRDFTPETYPDNLFSDDAMSPRYARAMVEFTTAVIHTESVEEVLWLLTDDIIADLGFEDCVVYLYDEEKNKLVQKAAFGHKNAGNAQILDPIELDIGQGITGRCAAEKRPILVADVSLDPEYVVDDIARQSELAVPILSDGALIGVIDSEHSEKNFYTPQHEAILQSLSAIITTRYENQRMLQELKDRERQLQYLADHDSLSGLPNRHYLVNALHERVSLFRTGEIRSLLVSILDLDRFKLVNDSYGHAAGDELIVGVSERLRKALPEYALLARLGGDEFAILASLAHSGEAIPLAETILQVFEKPISIKAASVRISASVGIALASSEICAESELLKLADGAMYRAKARGRGCYELRSGESGRAKLSDLTLENDLATALQEHQFLVYLQPMVDLESADVIGYEALIRWNHPRDGLVLPAEFLPIAERSGQIHDIDKFMLGSVLEKLDDQRVQGANMLPISVNVSASTLSRTDAFEALLERDSIDGLNIEVAEKSLLADSEQALLTLNELRRRGARILLDDFGTGYSSLSQIHTLPVDFVKIDRSFIDAIDRSARSQSLVRLIVATAQTIDAKLIAEGIETEAQRTALRMLNIRRGQGFLFGRPAPFDTVLPGTATNPVA